MNKNIMFLDCTFRDGGYYNSWDFSDNLINKYLLAMSSIHVDVVEIGFRTLKNNGFKGATAYTTDSFLKTLKIPLGLHVSVMVNASELISDTPQQQILEILFPVLASDSLVDMVRIACHYHEFFTVLPAAEWLKSQGYLVGFNLMQVSERSIEELTALSLAASNSSIDVLYFADSLGNLQLNDIIRIVDALSSYWQKDIGIHAHDNLGMALQNSLFALTKKVTWIDSTVTGMGRGPGNAKTEQLALEIAEIKSEKCNIVPLMSLITDYFKPMQQKCGWGTNTYYYLAGKYAIHPTYVQTMLADSRFSDEDIIAVLERLKDGVGRSFNPNTLDMARHFSSKEPSGSWCPRNVLEDHDVLLIGTGPGVMNHRQALEAYIKEFEPVVIAMNAQEHISEQLINYRIACHPVRLLADCSELAKLPQPLITPISFLPENVVFELKDKLLLDFGLMVSGNNFEFFDVYAILPNSLVLSYALATITSGKACRILLAGFDGFENDFLRNKEVDDIFISYASTHSSLPLISVTPTKFSITQKSIYASQI